MSKVDELKEQLKEVRADQIFCNFCSPGTLFTESSSFEVNNQDIHWAINKAKDIIERHGAKPFGFVFEDGNGKKLSKFYYLGGTVKKYEDIPDTKEYSILKSNLKYNNPVCIENTNSFRFIAAFGENDCVLNEFGHIIRSGDDKDLVEYRESFKNDG